MFKNISSRIIITFSCIVLAGILLFALITYGIFTKFSTSTDSSIMTLSAKNVADTVLGYTFLVEEATGNHNCSPEDVICDMYKPQFESNMVKYAEDNIGVHIYNTEGKLLVATSICHDETPLADKLREEADKRIAQGDFSGFSTQFVFHAGDTEKSNLFLLPIIESETSHHMGYVVVSTMSDGIYAARAQLISAIITSCIWILLGAAFSIVIIGKRIAKPFNEINHTLKQYSDGDTSVRIKINSDDEISELSSSINEMMNTIERNDKNKDTFLASVAHDLRTPMTTISGFADGILDGTIPPERQHQYLATISEETKRLSRLISTLLTTTKMQNQKIVPKVFNITEKAISTLFTFEGQIDDKSLKVEITNDSPVNVNADPDVIHQVLYNLIHNAVKFSPTGGSLVIDIQEDKSKGKAVITIRNDGSGIPEEEVPHVFEKFYKTDRSRGLDKSGMGLGLFIVKTAIDNHKEKITVESGTGRGCAFTFTLPLV
jgi:signal transduction histidine kinase